jgi:hypothetical protein
MLVSDRIHVLKYDGISFSERKCCTSVMKLTYV